MSLRTLLLAAAPAGVALFTAFPGGPSRAQQAGVPGDGGRAAVRSASGRVIDAQGRPVSGATVLIREWAYLRTFGMSEEASRELKRAGKLPDVLARTRTDAQGRFRVEGVVVPEVLRPEGDRRLEMSEAPLDLVVLAEGHGVAWSTLTPRKQQGPLTIALPSEARVQGRVTTPDGRPIAGAWLKVSDIARPSTPAMARGGTSEGQLSLDWSSVPIEAATDAEGRFTIVGLPPEMRVEVVARADGHRQISFYAATTERPQPDVEVATAQSVQVVTRRVSVRSGEVVVVMKPTDHRLVGRLVSGATGEPVAGADVFNGWERVGKTDADGRFTIEELAAGTVELHAKAVGGDSVPLDVEVEIPDGKKVVERTFRLPRGLAVSGRVVDDAGAAVPGAKLRYSHGATGDRLSSSFDLEVTSDAEGRFRLAVPAGPGQIALISAPPGYLGQDEWDLQPDGRFEKAVRGAPGDSISGLTLTLERGRRVVIRAVGPDGRAVSGAELRRYGARPGAKKEEPIRTDVDGQAEVAGLDPEGTYEVDVVHTGRKLGRRVEISPRDDREARAMVEAALAPLGSVEGRVLDQDGQPLSRPTIGLRISAQVRDGGMSETVEGRDEVGPDGSYRFHDLVPGASYHVSVEVPGHAGADSPAFTALPGAVRRLEPFHLPMTDRELEGVEVDPRGRPVAGATVGVDQDGLGRFDLSPRWSAQTDTEGRFRLTDLPRGALKVTAHRPPKIPGLVVTSRVRVEVPASQTELRVELPDPRRRPRVIED